MAEKRSPASVTRGEKVMPRKGYLQQVVRYNRWLWAVIVLVVLDFAVISALHYSHQQRLATLYSLEQSLLKAGDDMLLGLLHLTISDNLAGQEHQQALTLLRQAANRYQETLEILARQDSPQVRGEQLQSLYNEVNGFIDHIEQADAFIIHQQMYAFTHRSAGARRSLRDEIENRQERYGLLLNLSILLSVVFIALISLALYRIERRMITNTVELQRSEGRFRQLMEHIRDVFWLADVRRQSLLYVSPAYERNWGLSRNELLQSKQRWMLTPDQELRRDISTRLLRDGERVVSLDYQIKAADGQTRWIEDMAFPVLDEQGEVIRIAGIARDVTSKHQEQEQLKLLRTAIARLNDIVIISEKPPGETVPRVIFVNPVFEQITGYLADEILGSSISVLFGENTRTEERQRIRQSLVDWKPVRAEVIHRHKEGTDIVLELEIVPFANHQGEDTHWVTIARDISRRRQLEEQVQQSTRMEVIGQLTGGIAHDFNNLLTVIWGNGELLVEQLDSHPKLRQLAATIAKAAQRGGALIKQLLAFARKQTLASKAVDIEQLLNSMQPMLTSALGAHIELQIELEEGMDNALVDPVQLESAVLNLCINARDAMPNGGQLRLAACEKRLSEQDCTRIKDINAGRYVCITVEDEGEGIPPEILSRVFEPLFTTKEKGKGTGLGLSMVYSFVKQSNGHVEIASEPGEGTRIDLYLPVTDSKSDESADLVSEDEPETGTGVILLVEDDQLVREFAEAQLKAAGYTVWVAGNGRQALSILDNTPQVDLLLTDVVMPGGMNGKELADLVRKRRSGISVILTTGYADGALQDDVALAAEPVLMKPYRRHELLKLIHVTLKQGGRQGDSDD